MSGNPKKQTSQTIAQLAARLGLPPKDVSKQTRDVLRLSAREAKDRDYLLSESQCKQITDSLGLSESVVSAARSAGQIETSNPSEQEDIHPLKDRPDPPSDIKSLDFGKLNHGLWVHEDVWTMACEMPHIRKRVSLVLQHLGANGWPSVVKGCKDEQNRGWLRSPLGGQNGMQYYLWWAPKGNRPVKGLNIPDGGISIRAIRHHDDHKPLDAGDLGHFVAFKQSELREEGYFAEPWTEDQLRFVGANDPVRLILGKPGSGKTTVLWKALEARGNQSVLYLTWSRSLTEIAEKHFKAFAPLDLRVDARDFLGFLGEICQRDVERQSLKESQSKFHTLIGELRPDTLGVWANRPDALYAEVRAYLLGFAIPGKPVTESSSALLRLDDAEYLNRRGNGKGVGKTAAEGLLKIFRTVETDRRLAESFPELIAASEAIDRLRKGIIPDRFASLDRVVVDEVQDLTLLEANVVVELCRAIERSRGYAPWLLIAGDNGQTVRPSGFEWAGLNDMIARRVGTPKKFQLEENLRCPDRIDRVIERASRLYAHLNKDLRPTKQRNSAGGQHLDARLIHLDIQSSSDAVDLLEKLDDLDNMVVVSPDNYLPDWLPNHLRDAVLTPADTKGLEYQSVCLLNPGRVLAGLQREITPGGDDNLGAHARRTTIDQLRVALSRATETLAFIDVAASDHERELSWELLENPAPFDAEDLVDLFTNSDSRPEEAILARISDARLLVDERPARAWRRIHQAVRLLGDASLPNGIADPALRAEAEQTLLAIAARLLVDEARIGIPRAEIINVSQDVLRSMALASVDSAFQHLIDWTDDKSSPPFVLLESILDLGSSGDWMRNALGPAAQRIRQLTEQHSTNIAAAKLFSGRVEGWLELTKYSGDVIAEARKFRCGAFDVLKNAGEIAAAQVVLSQIKPEDSFRLGQLQEAQGQPNDAAVAFERAHAMKDALRNWRTAGRWEKAIHLAAGDEKADLEWLMNIEGDIAAMPKGHATRLTERERDRLETLLKNFHPKR